MSRLEQSPRRRSSGWSRDINRAHVDASIEEWRRLGRESFLRRYGVRQALRYILVDGGEEYDAKAILHGAQVLSGLPVKPGEFRGSRQDVAEPLRSLGYWVEDLKSDSEAPMGDNPQAYIESAHRLLGGTDRAAVVACRVEQKLIRGALGFYQANAPNISCHLCAGLLPSDLVVAAHIKRRSECSEAERLDVEHIAMRACRLGCDALFEEGYIAVEKTGVIVVAAKFRLAPSIGRIPILEGQTCRAWSPQTEAYFAWHRERVKVA